MGLRERLAEYEQPFHAIIAVATCCDSLCFGDLCWPPYDWEAESNRLIERREAGVIFETTLRVLAIEEHCGELRYYAGGWPSHQSRIYLEQYRMEAEGYEMGVFPTPRDAVLFAERFLADDQALQDIDTPRQVHRRQETDKNRVASR